MLKNMFRRGLVLPLTAAALMVTSACNDFLKVKNPGAIEEPEINNPAYITLLGEQLCSAPIGLSKAYTSDELLGFALDRFRSAISIATAAKAAAGGLAADSILNLGNVGAARVSLDLGNATQAATYAAAVPS